MLQGESASGFREIHTHRNSLTKMSDGQERSEERKGDRADNRQKKRKRGETLSKKR